LRQKKDAEQRGREKGAPSTARGHNGSVGETELLKNKVKKKAVEERKKNKSPLKLFGSGMTKNVSKGKHEKITVCHNHSKSKGPLISHKNAGRKKKKSPKREVCWGTGFWGNAYR